MKRGNLVIYDETGKIFSQTGEAEGDIMPHEYPVGLPWIEVPFGTMAIKRLVSVNVTDLSNPLPVFEDLLVPKSPEQIRIEELERLLELQTKG